jgi:hypothetical protein
MNEANKAKLANILTIIVAVIAGAQGTFFTVPPFSEETAFIISGICTYLVMAGTIWKQHLSPEVNGDSSKKVTWVIALIATLTGLVDLLNLVDLAPKTEQWVKLAISSLVTIINIGSKTIFPSMFQKEKMQELKFRPAETKKNSAAN